MKVEKKEKQKQTEKAPEIETTISQIKIENQSFEDQQKIRRQLLTEAGGDSASDYESDVEEIAKAERGSRKQGDMFGEYAQRKDRIFKHLTVRDKNVSIPDLPEGEEGKLTLFMELDDVLLHTFICDENFGYIANPIQKDPEHEFFMEEIRQPVLVYMRDHWEDFMQYLKDNSDIIEPIVYTSAL